MKGARLSYLGRDFIDFDYFQIYDKLLFSNNDSDR